MPFTWKKKQAQQSKVIIWCKHSTHVIIFNTWNKLQLLCYNSHNSVKRLIYGTYTGWNHISNAASLHHTTCSVHACKHPSPHVCVCVFSCYTLRRMSSVFFFPSPLTAQSAHGADPVQFQPKASSVPSPPWPVRLCSLLVGQSPLQQAQPGGLSLRLCIGPFRVLSRFDPRGEGGLLLWLAVQQVLQVVQGQKVIVAFQKLLHKLQEGEKRFNLWGKEWGRIIQSVIHFITLLSFFSCSPSHPSRLYLSYRSSTLNPPQSTLFFLLHPSPSP